MPDTQSPRPGLPGTRKASTEVPSTPSAAAPPHHFPVGVAWLILAALLAACAGLVVWWRRGATRAWQAFAREIGGSFTAKNRFSPARITGKIGARDFLLETALSYEDEAPYYHTRGCLPLRNPAGLVLGLRRKSLLEEAQTRRERPGFDLEDPDFERRFFVVCNDHQNLPAILTPEARRELARYSDVEVYALREQIEWRRSGEVDDVRALLRLTQLLERMVEAIDALPPQRRTLSERLADEALIEKRV